MEWIFKTDIWRNFKKFTSKEILNTLKNNPQESRREWMLNRFEYAGRNDKKIKNFKFWQDGNDAQEIAGGKELLDVIVV